ncbi:DUF6850 family outer membrane beta-barrel protein [Rapidithrix thailandica]|uniref:DUF6850 family outer membrane beta-barrel protein n=1 Tax=Rapidithrix thailandica TaxID=413964 RepID=A0AAW9S1K8_9BACT
MKSIIIFSLLFSFGLVRVPRLSAQVDSIPLPLKSQRWQWFRSMPTGLGQTMPEAYALSYFYADYRKQAFRQGRQPGYVKQFGFYTEGITKVKQVTLFGEARIEKELLTDHNWDLSHVEQLRGEQNVSPFHYAAYHPGNWDNQKYEFKLGFTVPLFNEKLQQALYLRYEASNYYRLQEPQPKIDYFLINFSYQAAFQLAPGWQVGAFVSKGKSEKEFNINYKDVYRDSPSFPEYYNRIVIGYGTVEGAEQRRGEPVKKDTDFGGFIQKTTSRQDAYLKIKRYSFTDEYIFPTIENGKRIGSDTIGDYRSDGWELNALIVGKSAYQSRFLRIQANMADGINYNRVLGGYNYLYKESALEITVGKTNWQRNYHSIWLGARYDTYQKEDTQAEVLLKVANLKGEVGWLKKYALPKGHHLQPLVEGSYTVSLSKRLQVGEGSVDQAFYQDIIQRDYFFATADKVSLTTGLEYEVPMKKESHRAFIQIQGNLLQAIATSSQMEGLPESWKKLNLTASLKLGFRF